MGQRLVFLVRMAEVFLVKRLLILGWLMMWGVVWGEVLVPQPKEVVALEGRLLVDVQSAVIAPEELGAAAQVMAEALQRTTGYLHRVRTPEQVGRMVYLRAIRLAVDEGLEEQGYEVKISEEGMEVRGGDVFGVMAGVQTVSQLLPHPKEGLPRVFLDAQVIRDEPVVKRRIFRLDVSGHLFPTDDLQKLLRWLSYHKVNEFHLQLNGDAGWRMESVQWVRLHEVGSVREAKDGTEYRGYYTQDNLRDLVAFAETQGVTVVPTFSFTTGAGAMVSAYPELADEGAGVKDTEENRVMLRGILAEAVGIFSSKWVRLEGPGEELHDFLRAELKERGRELMEGRMMEGLDFSVYSRPEAGELLRSSDLVAKEGLLTVGMVYGQDWREGMEAFLETTEVRDFGKLQYQVFPRLAAFAEGTWGSQEGFAERLAGLMKRYDRMGIRAATVYEEKGGGGALRDGVRVSSTMEAVEGYPLEFVYDGDEKRVFWSKESVKAGDEVVLEFPASVMGEVEVVTGAADESGQLWDGVLEFSDDGKAWGGEVKFFAGVAKGEVPSGNRWVRLRATGTQDDRLMVREVKLKEAFLKEKHEETREVSLFGGREKEVVELTFRADFVGRPELREVVGRVRSGYFREWVRLATGLGVERFAGTPRTLELGAADWAELGEAVPEEWLVERLLPSLQSYAAGAPEWFASGMAHRLAGRESGPVNLDGALDGGGQSAAFLGWVAKEFGEGAVISISQECRTGRYQDERWSFYTRHSLPELVGKWQEAAKK